MTADATRMVETHSAVVLFLGDRAYKVKKPVDLGFLDFSTRAARERACHREVTLNRRLAPDVYLGVADVVGPDGEVCDHLVVMRRMPDERRLAHLIARGEDVSGRLLDVARQVAALHAEAPTSRTEPEIARAAAPEAVAANWDDNLATLRSLAAVPVPPDEIERVGRLAHRYLDGRAPLLRERIASGAARDGHGDLLAEDIFCLDDGPRILDCLEFADHYRLGDVLLDVAFLAMDLERLGRTDDADAFLTAYTELTGDRHPESLVHHYVAYRAHVRAKVAGVRHAQGDPTMAAQARDLHRLALTHLRRGRVALVLVGGLPASGKSTVARALADAHGWTVLRSDEVRKELAGLDPTTPAPAAYGQALYRPEARAAVYRELLARARVLLEHGESVVLDASFAAAADRDAAAHLAGATHSDLVQLRCEVDAEVARDRLAARPPGTDASDATEEVRAAMAARAEPWPEAAVVRTEAPPDAVRAAARAAAEAQLRRAEETDTTPVG